MKPPVVHQPVQPPQPLPGGQPPADEQGVLADTSERRRPGLVGDFGPIVDAPEPDFDFAPEPEIERRRH